MLRGSGLGSRVRNCSHRFLRNPKCVSRGLNTINLLEVVTINVTLHQPPFT